MTQTAFVFPGQGSQSVGMLADMASQYPLVLDRFDKVSQCVGYDVWDLVQNGPEIKLNQTEHTQVAVLVADVVTYELLEQKGIAKASVMAGHSLGEYAALVCSGAISLTDAARLVQKRGQLMQETVPLGQGAMAAIIGMTDEDVEKLCALASTVQEHVTPANFNAIGQVVIAGHTQAVERAIVLAEEMGAMMAKNIPVSVPCHCPLLMEAAREFTNDLQRVEFKVPRLSVISNVDLSFYESTDQIRALLSEQLYRPVRWVETIQTMKNIGITRVVECGPGKVLTGLIKRIDKSLQSISVNNLSSLDSALTLLG
jgi:[acyl-carrier-protein] S-malonyltransferase